MNKIVPILSKLRERAKPKRCNGTEMDYDDYGCSICGAKYHCGGCGGGTGMYGHYVRAYDDEGLNVLYEGHWCELASQAELDGLEKLATFLEELNGDSNE